MEFYNLHNIQNVDITYPDVYFTPEYGSACEYSDNAIWELCSYKDLIYVYLKKPIVFENTTYYDLITPYGYSGYHYSSENTFDEFIPLFRKKAREKKYLTEVLRQNPYLNISIRYYDVITSKKIFGVKTDDFDTYFNHTLKGTKRRNFKYGQKDEFSFELLKIENDILQENFITLYHLNMKKVNATKYYYFNQNYFDAIQKIKKPYLALCRDTNYNIIGSMILFVHDDKVHYHLSCNNNSCKYITDFLIINVIKHLCINKVFILGGGLKNDDNLSRYKKSLRNVEFDYIIYKNILNKYIYDKLATNAMNSNYFPLYR